MKICPERKDEKEISIDFRLHTPVRCPTHTYAGYTMRRVEPIYTLGQVEPITYVYDNRVVDIRVQYEEGN